MTEQNEHIDRLITRYISGEASPEERRELELWLNESEANQKYFGDIQFVNQSAVNANVLFDVDVDKAWSHVNAQMKNRTLKTEVKHSSIIPLWIKVAASVAILVGASFALLHQFNFFVTNTEQTFSIASSNTQETKYFADSSQVVLNSHSKVTYAKDYGKKERRVNLEGEAFFDVKHLDNSPFIVEAEGTLIKDIGTSFNIKAQSQDSLVEVYVKSGEVLFFTSESKGISLYQGEIGIYNKTTGLFSKTVCLDPNITSYVNRVFVFQNTRLAEIAQQLSKAYNVSIVFKNPELKDCTISVAFTNEEIDVILDIISETLLLKIEKQDQLYIITGEACFKE